MNKVYERWWDSDKQQWMYQEDEIIARLRAALEAAKIPHYVCDEDCWYSCPKSDYCCNDTIDREKCNCGADAHNAKIDEALK